MSVLAACVSFEGLTGTGADNADVGGSVKAGMLDDATTPAPLLDGSVADALSVGETTPDAVVDNPTPATTYIYAGYKGGPFNIIVDAPEANIVIGIVTAEPVQVTLTGVSLHKVSEVHFAGKGANASTVSGIDPNLVTQAAQAPAKADPQGVSTIQCQYEGGAHYHVGECNTRDQIVNYFQQKFGGAIASHACQYQAYTGTRRLINIERCSCRATTCEDDGKVCGAYADGCGGTIMSCGTCAVAGTQCGAFGAANQCGGCALGQQVAGPRSPTTLQTVPTTGSRPWSNPTMANVSDDLRATVTGLSKFNRSDMLQALGFGFQVPAGATINGVYLEVERATDRPSTDFADEDVMLVSAGALVGVDRARRFDNWTPSDFIDVPKDALAMYGGPNDTWAAALTAADVNAATFGASVSATYGQPNGSGTAAIDAMRMWICYTPAPLDAGTDQ